MSAFVLFLALLAGNSSPALHDLSVSNGSRPFAGDGRLLTTVSPNGDGSGTARSSVSGSTRAATVRARRPRERTRSDRRQGAEGDLEHATPLRAPAGADSSGARDRRRSHGRTSSALRASAARVYSERARKTPPTRRSCAIQGRRGRLRRAQLRARASTPTSGSPRRRASLRLQVFHYRARFAPTGPRPQDEPGRR